MSCFSGPSSITFRLDNDECFISFEFTKSTCRKEITAQTGYNHYCRGKKLKDIFNISYQEAIKDLKIKEEEQQFVLYLEWDALRSAVGQYLGINNEDIDNDRCQIASIEHNEHGIKIAQILLPPREMPTIFLTGSNNTG